MVAFSDADRDQLNEILKHGGTHTMVIAKSDISSNDFEQLETVKPHLEIGFRIPMPPIPGDAKEAADMIVYGDEWAKLLIRLQLRGGDVTYRKRADGKFEATITI